MGRMFGLIHPHQITDTLSSYLLLLALSPFRSITFLQELPREAEEDRMIQLQEGKSRKAELPNTTLRSKEKT